MSEGKKVVRVYVSMDGKVSWREESTNLFTFRDGASVEKGDPCFVTLFDSVSEAQLRKGCESERSCRNDGCEEERKRTFAIWIDGMILEGLSKLTSAIAFRILPRSWVKLTSSFGLFFFFFRKRSTSGRFLLEDRKSSYDFPAMEITPTEVSCDASIRRLEIMLTVSFNTRSRVG